MLATGSCCCCCAHKDTALPDGKHHGPEGRTESKIDVSRAGTSLLKSPRKSLLYVSRCRLLGAAVAAAADPSKRRLPARKPHATEGRQRLLLLLLCPQKHGPGVSRGRNVPSEISYKNLLYTFLAAGSL